jgi:hypothetical protein
MGGYQQEEGRRERTVLAAEALYGSDEAAVEVGGPPHPGLLGPDVLPHSAVPAAAAHLLDRQRNDGGTSLAGAREQGGAPRQVLEGRTKLPLFPTPLLPAPLSSRPL